MAKAYNEELVIDKRGATFGNSSAVALFQRQMEEFLREDSFASGVQVYLGNIFIFMKTLEDHLALLGQVLSKLPKCELKIRK